MKPILKRTLLLAVLGLIVALPGFLAAQTLPVLNYPGAWCIPVSGVGAKPNVSGHIENTSATSTVTVMCPVLVENPDSPYSTSGKPIVYLTDNHYSQGVCCSARAKNTGSSVKAGGEICTWGSKSDSTQVYLTNPSVGGTFTHRFIQCSIPPTYTGQKSEVRLYMF